MSKLDGGGGGYDSRRSRLIHFLITEKYMVLPAAAEFNLQPRQTAAESALYGGTRANRWRAFLPAHPSTGPSTSSSGGAAALYTEHSCSEIFILLAGLVKKNKQKNNNNFMRPLFAACSDEN